MNYWFKHYHDLPPQSSEDQLLQILHSQSSLRTHIIASTVLLRMYNWYVTCTSEWTQNWSNFYNPAQATYQIISTSNWPFISQQFPASRQSNVLKYHANLSYFIASEIQEFHCDTKYLDDILRITLSNSARSI